MKNKNSKNEEKVLQKSNGCTDIIFRQELNSYTPICNLKCAIICNLFLIILFVILGGPIIALSWEVVEYKVDYTNCPIDENIFCKIPITITKKMELPIFLYYSLTNFHLNQRDLVRSRSFPQLRNEADATNYTRCEGAKTIGEMFDYNEKRYTNPWNVKLEENSIANPCGLTSKTYFNDTYLFFDSNDMPIYINETNIANDSDKKFNFKRHLDYKNKQWIDVENEHFIVWMQSESFSDFDKLYGRIEKALEPGNYYINVKSYYNVAHFGGTKQLLLTTSSQLGKTDLLGWILLLGAALCFFIIIIILLCLIRGSRLYKLEDMKWD